MNKICYGCGVKLQNIDKEKVGYTPKEDAEYCMRCFRMINYGENNETATPKDIKEIVNKINKDTKFVIFLSDFLNVNKKVIDIFKSIKKRKVLIINKCELIPKHLNKNKFLNYVINHYDIKDEVKLKGGNNNRGANIIKNYLEKNDIKNAYILGLSNSGKSTLINDLIDLYGTKVNKLTVNKKANTTLDFVRVKLNDETTLIDSPGFIIDDYINLDVENKNIVQYTFNMKENETLLLLNKYYFKFINSTPVTFYITSIDKNNLKKVYKDIPTFENKFEINNNEDLYIYGIGFLNIKNKSEIITNINEKNIEIRSSIFGGSNE